MSNDSIQYYGPQMARAIAERDAAYNRGDQDGVDYANREIGRVQAAENRIGRDYAETEWGREEVHVPSHTVPRLRSAYR